MFYQTQMAFGQGCMARWRRAALALASLSLTPALLFGQTPPRTIGRISGDDISVEGGTPAVSSENPRSVTLSNGSVVTVHSGKAGIELAAGGEIDICGPARLTLLESAGALTIALNLGRVRVQLPGPTPLVVYTPFFVATPIALTDGARDATLGLQDNGALCVLAARGGVRLEQQLTGQTVMVPQPNELSLMGGDLIPVDGVTGGCRCELLTARAAPMPEPVIPPAPTAAPRESSPPPAAVAKKPAASRENAKLPAPATEFSVPAHTSEADTPTRAASPPPGPPAIEQPVWKVVMPPLSFNAASPLPPPEPSPDTILLVREVRVEPDWVFSGRVESRLEPTLPPAQVRAADQKPTAQDAPRQKKRGFFGKIGNFFRRLAGAPPCAGAGCSQ